MFGKYLYFLTKASRGHKLKAVTEVRGSPVTWILSSSEAFQRADQQGYQKKWQRKPHPYFSLTKIQHN